MQPAQAWSPPPQWGSGAWGGAQPVCWDAPQWSAQAWGSHQWGAQQWGAQLWVPLTVPASALVPADQTQTAARGSDAASRCQPPPHGNRCGGGRDCAPASLAKAYQNASEKAREARKAAREGVPTRREARLAIFGESWSQHPEKFGLRSCKVDSKGRPSGSR
jgi:hypothetical protein